MYARVPYYIYSTPGTVCLRGDVMDVSACKGTNFYENRKTFGGKILDEYTNNVKTNGRTDENF